MRIASLLYYGEPVLAVRRESDYVNLAVAKPLLPHSLRALLEQGPASLASAAEALSETDPDATIPVSDAVYLPPITDARKILCLGLNYSDHAAESNNVLPTYPVVFARFATSYVAANAPLVASSRSSEFDYEAELVVIIGQNARNVSKANALDYVAGYSIFNEGSYRDYQLRTPQWTMGKNFDASGAFGPEVVTADELPPGAAGLRITSRLNGETLQDGNTENMIFNVSTTIATLSEVMTLEPGDLLVMGTPAGVGFARKPPVYMRPGDHIEVEIERIGILSNSIVSEAAVSNLKTSGSRAA